VGAFKERYNAERFRAKLSTRYKNAHIYPYSDFRGAFFRVRVGKFSNLDDAETFTRELERAGAKQAFIVAE